MSAVLAPVAPRLCKLLALLSSEHDGEIVAAARAIGRMLGNAGLSWHDLANVLTGSAERGKATSVSWSRMPRADRLRILERLLATDDLTRWERAFCRRIHAALHVWPNAEQSWKQAALVDELIWRVLQ